MFFPFATFWQSVTDRIRPFRCLDQKGIAAITFFKMVGCFCQNNWESRLTSWPPAHWWLLCWQDSSWIGTAKLKRPRPPTLLIQDILVWDCLFWSPIFIPGSFSTVSVWPSLHHKTARVIQKAEALFFMVGFANSCQDFLILPKGGLHDSPGLGDDGLLQQGVDRDLLGHPLAPVHPAAFHHWHCFYKSHTSILVLCDSFLSDWQFKLGIICSFFLGWLSSTSYQL